MLEGKCLSLLRKRSVVMLDDIGQKLFDKSLVWRQLCGHHTMRKVRCELCDMERRCRCQPQVGCLQGVRRWTSVAARLPVTGEHRM
jgi:hypothetical protein